MEKSMKQPLFAVALTSALFIGFAAPQVFAKNKLEAVGAGAKPAYPVCDSAHKDNCIEIGKYAFIDRMVNHEYPQCARIKDLHKKANCIEVRFRSHGPHLST